MKGRVTQGAVQLHLKAVTRPYADIEKFCVIKQIVKINTFFINDVLGK